jgi:hypothetical protein
MAHDLPIWSSLFKMLYEQLCPRISTIIMTSLVCLNIRAVWQDLCIRGGTWAKVDFYIQGMSVFVISSVLAIFVGAFQGTLHWDKLEGEGARILLYGAYLGLFNLIVEEILPWILLHATIRGRFVYVNVNVNLQAIDEPGAPRRRRLV